MSSLIKVVGSAMHAQQARVESTSHNLANVNTTGYKTTRIEFQDREYRRKVIASDMPAADGSTVTAEAWVGSGVDARSRTIFAQGAPIFTGRATDMAIIGEGFFTVTLPGGSTGYTRNGAFSIDTNGQLVSGEGYPLDPPIRTQAGTTLSIGESGEVMYVDPSGAIVGSAGNIRLARFVNPEGLQPVSRGIYLATAASGEPQLLAPGDAGVGRVAAGAVEQSNVGVAEEMVSLMEAQRAYQVAAKAVSAIIEMLDEANSLDRQA